MSPAYGGRRSISPNRTSHGTIGIVADAAVVALDQHQIGMAVPSMVRAFWDYEESLHLVPSPSARHRVLPAYLRSDLRDAARFGTLFGARSSNGIVGAAAWLPPWGYPPTIGRELLQLIAVLPALPWTLGTAREALRGRGENRRRHAQVGAHYYLMALGVDPAAQGQGLGSALLSPILKRADEEGVGCFLFTARAANVSWYGRFRFASIDTYVPTPTWPTVWAMWRDTN